MVTGFEGDLALPSTIIHQLDAQPLFLSFAVSRMARCENVLSISLPGSGMTSRELWRFLPLNTIRCWARCCWRVGVISM